MLSSHFKISVHHVNEPRSEKTATETAMNMWVMFDGTVELLRWEMDIGVISLLYYYTIMIGRIDGLIRRD